MIDSPVDHCKENVNSPVTVRNVFDFQTFQLHSTEKIQIRTFAPNGFDIAFGW